MSVWGTVSQHLKLRDFSWKRGINNFVCSKEQTRHYVLEYKLPDFPRSSSYTLKPPMLYSKPTGGLSSLLRHPIAMLQSTGILTCFPSTTHFCLALGADSPCADERCAGNLGLSACGLFTRIIVTYVSIRTSDTSSKPYDSPSTAYRTLLYRARLRVHPQLRYTVLAPLNLSRGPTRPVSYYAFFKGWLLLSQPPGCLGLSTSFAT